MIVELTLSPDQLSGKRPIYIKGRKYWLIGEQERRRFDLIKAEARNLRTALKAAGDFVTAYAREKGDIK